MSSDSRMPLRPGPSETHPSGGQEETASSRRPVRILLVEDSADDAALLEVILRAAGLDVEIVLVDSAETMRRALGEPLDLVISDYNVPGFGGRQALSLLNASGRDLPFIIVSAAVGEDIATAMMRAGAKDYVMKSNLTRLVPAIRRELHEAEIRRRELAAEEALQELQERFQATFEQAAAGMAHLSPEGRFLRVNEKMAQMLGVSAEEMIGMSGFEFVHPRDEAASRAAVGAIVRGEVRNYQAERRLCRRDGTEFDAFVTNAAVLDESGVPKYSIAIFQDVSERKRAERLVREEASLLAATLEATADAIVVVDFEWRMVRYNRRYLEMWGFEPGVFHDDARAAARRVIAGVRNAAEVAPVMERLQRSRSGEASGSVETLDGRTIEWHTAPQMLDGQPTARVWSYRDVTSRVQAQRGLEESESRYRSLIDNIPDAVWTAAADGRNVFASANSARLLGLSPAELRNVQLAELVHPDDRQAMSTAFRRLVEHGEPYDVEQRVRHRDGGWVWLHSRATARYERNGEVMVDGISTDITAVKDAEAARDRMAHERQLLLDCVGEGIIGTDLAGVCTFVNRAALRILGYEPAELIGRVVHDVIHYKHADGAPRSAEDCAVTATLARGEQMSGRTTYWRRDGTPILADCISSPLRDGDQLRGAVLVFNDVTERTALERRLEQAGRVQSLGRVAATVAHEFNNVLQGILPFAEIVRREAGQSDRLQTAAEHIGRSVQRGRRVAEEILRFTNPKDPLLITLDLRSTLSGIAAELRGTLSRDCSLELDLGERPILVRADPQQLEQVVVNLILNARDAMEGRGTIRLSLDPRCASPAVVRQVAGRSSLVDIVCRDNGPGISAELMERIFEPLFTTKRNGTGLGLAVAQQIVTQHGGELVVESRPGEGTAFHLLLPQASA